MNIRRVIKLAQSRSQIISTNRNKTMSLQDKAKATAKNVEGKVQEAVGNVTGDPKTQAEGKAKQVEAEARHTGEDVKDAAKKIINK